MKRLCSGLLITLLPLSAWAQSAASTDGSDADAPSRWRLGVGVIATDHAYVGQSERVTPFPFIDYEGDRFFFRGVTGGAHLIKSGGLSVDAIVTPGFNQIDANDFSRTDLMRRGINRSDLDDRDLSIDAGFAASWKSAAGVVKAVAKTDVSGHSEGAEYSLEYGYPMTLGHSSLIPAVGATFLSSKVADYYYGIHPDEVRRGVAAYQPGGSLIPEASVTWLKPVGSKWALMVVAKYSLLPNKISDSPLIDGDHGSALMIGFTRGF